MRYQTPVKVNSAKSTLMFTTIDILDLHRDDGPASIYTSKRDEISFLEYRKGEFKNIWKEKTK